MKAWTILIVACLATNAIAMYVHIFLKIFYPPHLEHWSHLAYSSSGFIVGMIVMKNYKDQAM